MKQWFSRKEVHVFGPVLPAGFGTESQNNKEGAIVDIKIFLGEMLVPVQHGKQSVFLVRFFFKGFQLHISYFLLRFLLTLSTGCQFRNMLTSWSKPWLKNKSTFARWQLLSVCDSKSLLSQILAYASQNVKSSDQLAERIKSSGMECKLHGIHSYSFWITRYYMPNSTSGYL